MKLSMLVQLYMRSRLRSERGIALAVVLAVVVLLMGLGSTALFSGYTNLLTSTNLRIATRARVTAEVGVNEALYRLSRQETNPAVIMPNVNDPDWQVEIDFTSGDTNASDGEVSTILASAVWPEHVPDEPVIVRFKKPDPTGNPSSVLFYNRIPNPHFTEYPLPAAPGDIPDSAHPVIQILATALDERGAERQILAEATYSVAFPPPAAISSGVDVDMNGSGFIDATNHSHLIRFTNASGNADVYGNDANTETTKALSVNDSPDSSAVNPSVSSYTTKARVFNMQTVSGPLPPTPTAWVGLTWNPASNQWLGVNDGAVSPIALTQNQILLGAVSASPSGGATPYSSGLFTWMKNSDGGVPLADRDPPFPTLCTSYPPPFVCRPPELTPFPSFQEYLGLDDVSFQNLLDNADVTKADLNAGQRPRGFTYIDGNYTFNNSSPMPLNDEFILMYVKGDLRFNGNARIKGVLFIDGDLDTTGTNYFLGAIMVRGITETDALGSFTLLYSKKTAELGLQMGKPWRILSWTDTAMQ